MEDATTAVPQPCPSGDQSPWLRVLLSTTANRGILCDWQHQQQLTGSYSAPVRADAFASSTTFSTKISGEGENWAVCGNEGAAGRQRVPANPAGVGTWDVSGPYMLGSARPCMREVSSLASWCYCFLGYVAMRTTDPSTQDQLAHARLIIREAQCHGGLGWLDYDRAFRQQAANDSSMRWNTLSPSLQAATIFG
jgi:hypothetical protein